MLSFSISYWDLIKFPYFADTTERGDTDWKHAQREGEDRVSLPITLMFHQITRREMLSIMGCLQWWTCLTQETLGFPQKKNFPLPYNFLRFQHFKQINSSQIDISKNNWITTKPKKKGTMVVCKIWRSFIVVKHLYWKGLSFLKISPKVWCSKASTWRQWCQAHIEGNDGWSLWLCCPGSQVPNFPSHKVDTVVKSPERVLSQIST